MSIDAMLLRRLAPAPAVPRLSLTLVLESEEVPLPIASATEGGAIYAKPAQVSMYIEVECLHLSK